MTLLQLVTVALPALNVQRTDQQAWFYMKQFDDLASRNVQTNVEQMEQE